MTTASRSVATALSQGALARGLLCRVTPLAGTGPKERAESNVICTLMGTIDGSFPDAITSSVISTANRKPVLLLTQAGCIPNLFPANLRLHPPSARALTFCAIGNAYGGLPSNLIFPMDRFLPWRHVVQHPQERDLDNAAPVRGQRRAQRGRLRMRGASGNLAAPAEGRFSSVVGGVGYEIKVNGVDHCRRRRRPRKDFDELSDISRTAHLLATCIQTHFSTTDPGRITSHYVRLSFRWGQAFVL